MALWFKSGGAGSFSNLILNYSWAIKILNLNVRVKVGGKQSHLALELNRKFRGSSFRLRPI